MSDWSEKVLTVLISNLVTAGFVTALFKGWLSFKKVSHEQNRVDKIEDHKLRRIDRKDEIAILHESIAELRRDRDHIQKDLAEKDKIIAELRDEHTACLVEQERQRNRADYLQQENEDLQVRVSKLEQKMNEIWDRDHSNG